MAEDKGSSLVILGIVAVIAIVGLVILLSEAGLTGKASLRPYTGAQKVYGPALKPQKTLQIYTDGDTSDILSQPSCPHGFRKVSKSACSADPACLQSSDGLHGCVPTAFSLTGDVPLQRSDCFALAKAYDEIVIKTISRAGAAQRSVTTINPCAGTSSDGTERVFDAQEPQRDYARVQFSNGDAWGVIGGLQARNVQYAVCSGYKARVRISGVDLCNTIS